MQKTQALNRAHELADAGRLAELVEYVGACPNEEIENSPTLSLLYGTAQARLGRHDVGTPWVELALSRARLLGEQSVETRALNCRGAINFVTGQIDDAADYFTQALISASRDRDHATIGRCSNNLGLISNMRGRYTEAIGSYSTAIAAYERAGLNRGVAECRHNLGITYSEQGDYERALREATLAIDAASVSGDQALTALTVRGSAEILVLQGELTRAQSEVERALEVHRELGDVVEEAEDLRIVAAVQAANGEIGEAEDTLRVVMARAELYTKPQLLAEATRDLAWLLRHSGRWDEAQEAVRAAIRLFDRLGAESEIRKLDSHDWGYPLTEVLRRALEPLHEAQRLADMGRFAELVAYLDDRPRDQVEQSPMLALMYGIGFARLGRLGAGHQWVMVALSRARTLGDRALEVRALNVYGAIALERGGIDEATDFFTRAQAQAMAEGDLASVARCANNLGVIANMQGDHGRAVGCLTMAIAAYQRAGFERGVAEAHHNLGIAYRDQGNFREALRAADIAVTQAEQLGDSGFKAQALAGRAEIRVLTGEAAVARREAERALQVHQGLGSTVRESEDLRILAGALAALGEVTESERMLRDVIDRATDQNRPLLIATAQRDLARLLLLNGRRGEALEVARGARGLFENLGSSGEVRRLDEMLARAAA